MTKKFEVVYAEFIEAEDFFDAVDKAKKEGREVLSVSEAPEELDDDYVFDWTNKKTSDGRRFLWKWRG